VLASAFGFRCRLRGWLRLPLVAILGAGLAKPLLSVLSASSSLAISSLKLLQATLDGLVELVDEFPYNHHMKGHRRAPVASQSPRRSSHGQLRPTGNYGGQPGGSTVSCGSAIEDDGGSSA
jgi:hypothetical protein